MHHANATRFEWRVRTGSLDSPTSARTTRVPRRAAVGGETAVVGADFSVCVALQARARRRAAPGADAHLRRDGVRFLREAHGRAWRVRRFSPTRRPSKLVHAGFRLHTLRDRLDLTGEAATGHRE